jgi:competence protein ComEC
VLPTPAWLAGGVVAASVAALASGGLAGAAMVAGVAGTAACILEFGGRPKRSAALAAAALGAALIVARLAVGVVVVGHGADGPPVLPAGTGSWQAGVESAHVAKGQQIATIRLADPPLLCSAQFPAFPRLIAGDAVTWSGRIRPLTDSDYDRYLAAQGIGAKCEATSLTVVGHDDSPAGRLEAFRQASGDALQLVLPEPAGGLAAAILIGLRDRVDRDLAAAFTTAGVSHVVAISGWNIAIVAATVAALLRKRLSRRRCALATIVSIVAYTLFAGASPSVVRAALMAGVALLAVESGRGSRAMVGLGWAATIMIVAEPATVGDAGFQLSAAATAGLVAWAKPLTEWLGRHAMRLPAVLRESLGISLAAQAATLPIALLDFGRLAVIAPAANLVVVPLVPPVMAAGTVAFGAGWLATLGAPAWVTGPMAMPAALLLAVLMEAVRVFAAIPGANQTLPFPFNVAGAAGAIGLLVAMHRALKRARRRAIVVKPKAARAGAAPQRLVSKYRGLLAVAVLVAAMAGSAFAGRPDGSVHIIVLDIGQGDAILIEGDRGGRILVDGGPDPNLLISRLDGFVPAWDRRLDAIVLTHPHDDHVAGLVAVVERYRVGRAFEPGWIVDTPAYRAWKATLTAHGLEPERLRTGETLRLDDATLRVLWPDDGTTRSAVLDPAATSNRQTNDASIVLLGEFEERRFLLTGDAEEDIDPILVSRGLPTVDMLKVAHHGSSTASSDALLASVRPAVAVISVGANNTYGHPNGGTVARLRAHSSRVARTDLDGTVEVTLDRSAVTVSRTRGDAPEAGAPAAMTVATGLLYDSIDVRPEPSRERGLAPIAGTTGLAPPPRAGGRRDCRLAGVACGVGRSVARSPPGRGGGVAA